MRTRPAVRKATRHKEPCGCNPYGGVICPGCMEAYRASDVCWHCQAGDPVAMRDGVPCCTGCLRAFKEAGAGLQAAS